MKLTLAFSGPDGVVGPVRLVELCLDVPALSEVALVVGGRRVRTAADHERFAVECPLVGAEAEDYEESFHVTQQMKTSIWKVTMLMVSPSRQASLRD